MMLSEKMYLFLKWLVLIALPALSTLYCVIDNIFCIGVADIVAPITAAVCACIGTLIGISTANYNCAMSEYPEDD